MQYGNLLVHTPEVRWLPFLHKTSGHYTGSPDIHKNLRQCGIYLDFSLRDKILKYANSAWFKLISKLKQIHNANLWISPFSLCGCWFSAPYYLFLWHLLWHQEYTRKCIQELNYIQMKSYWYLLGLLYNKTKYFRLCLSNEGCKGSSKNIINSINWMIYYV